MVNILIPSSTEIQDIHLFKKKNLAVPLHHFAEQPLAYKRIKFFNNNLYILICKEIGNSNFSIQSGQNLTK